MASLEQKRIVLLVNLGSPNTLSLKGIRRFLSNFLSDRRVVNLPKILWYPILYGVILPFRAKRLIKEYSKIWLNDQAPLIHHTEKQVEALQTKYLSDSPETIVCHAFSYCDPQINQVLEKLHINYSITKLIILPLYPQFSSTTTLPVFDAVAKFYRTKKKFPELHIIRDFHDHDLYIEAIAESIKKSWLINGRSEKLVFSYHSLPQVIVEQGDTYYLECVATTLAIVKRLNLSRNDYIIGFQSKFGSQKWLTPSTSEVLVNLAKNNIKSVDIICPGFISDCLETLQEIAIINRGLFIDNGGKKYNYIPCINENSDGINLMYRLTKTY